MRNKVKMAITAALMLGAMLYPVSLMAQGSSDAGTTNTNVSESTTGGQVLNPYPGEQITDRQPMIGIKLPTPEPPIDPLTIQIFIDGTDVTSETQISIDYIFYTPVIPLKLGSHNVRVTYKDTAGTAASPVNWNFIVVEKVVKVELPKVEQKPSTTGKLDYRFAAINLDNGVRNGNWPDTDIKYQEAFTNSGTFSFTHKFYGKALTGSYQRDIEEITGRANDYYSFNYIDQSHDIVLGDVPATLKDFSELTMNGVRLRGIKAINPLNEKYTLTSFYGRTLEPQSGRYKRMTTGFKLDTSASKNDDVRIIVLTSKEHGTTTAAATPKHDSIASLQNKFVYNKRWNLNSELVYDNHTERGQTAAVSKSGKETASRNYIDYTGTRISAEAGRRNFGPLFNPSTLGTFTESDREGTYGSFQYKPSTRFLVKTFFDEYHNNLHHNANVNNYTDKSTNSITSMNLTYPQLPMITARYGKLYTSTDAPYGNPNTQRSESTTENYTASKNFNDFWNFNGSSAAFMFSRYDIDRTNYAAGGTSTIFNMRSDTRSWTFTTRYKAFALVTYNTSLNKTESDSRSGAVRGINNTKTNTDRIGVQLNIVPFKFITNVNFKRTGTKTYTTSVNGAVSSTSLSAAPLERQTVVTFIYYLTQRKKLNLEYEDYDKEYRALINTGRSYDEQIFRLGYSLDF